MKLHDLHFQKFRSCIEDHTAWVGREPRQWAQSIGVDNAITETLCDHRVDRNYIKSICHDDKIGTETCFLTIMAWGGMKSSHGRLIWELRQDWLPILECVRSGTLIRSEAFQKFKEFRRRNSGCGMGPAYYTKLIFFAAPQHDGYIMDQWTALGINLLFNQEPAPIVDLITSEFRGNRIDTVSDKNLKETYEEFCKKIEYLANKLDISPEEVEMRLFSKGGRSPGAWRAYVKANRPQKPRLHAAKI